MLPTPLVLKNLYQISQDGQTLLLEDVTVYGVLPVVEPLPANPLIATIAINIPAGFAETDPENSQILHVSFEDETLAYYILPAALVEQLFVGDAKEKLTLLGAILLEQAVAVVEPYLLPSLEVPDSPVSTGELGFVNIPVDVPVDVPVEEPVGASERTAYALFLKGFARDSKGKETALKVKATNPLEVKQFAVNLPVDGYYRFQLLAVAVLEEPKTPTEAGLVHYNSTYGQLEISRLVPPLPAPVVPIPIPVTVSSFESALPTELALEDIETTVFALVTETSGAQTYLRRELAPATAEDPIGKPLAALLASGWLVVDPLVATAEPYLFVAPVQVEEVPVEELEPVLPVFEYVELLLEDLELDQVITSSLVVEYLHLANSAFLLNELISRILDIRMSGSAALRKQELSELREQVIQIEEAQKGAAYRFFNGYRLEAQRVLESLNLIRNASYQ